MKIIIPLLPQKKANGQIDPDELLKYLHETQITIQEMAKKI